MKSLLLQACRRLLPAAAMAAWGAAAMAAPATPADAASAREACFKEVMQELDMNGDVLVYLNGADLFKNTMQKIGEFAAAVPPSNDGTAEKAQDYVKRTDAFLGSSGLYAVRGMGFSSVPRSDGLHTFKAFVARDPAAAGLPLWTALGGEPRTLKSLAYLPKDTGLAQVTNVDARAAWNLIRNGINQIGGASALADMDRSLARTKAGSGFDLDALLQACGDEAFFSIQLSETTNSALPMGPNGKLVFPQPSLLLGVALKDVAAVTAMLDNVAAQNQGGNAPVVKQVVNGRTYYTMTNPVPAPFPLQAAAAVQDGYLFIGSSPDALNAAFAAQASGNNLASTPDFQKAFAGLPTKVNSIGYVHPRFAKAVQDVQLGMMRNGGPNPAFSALMQKWTEATGITQSAGVRVNRPNGILMQGVSPRSGRQTMLTLSVAPVAVVAGVALPAMMQARMAAAHGGRNGPPNAGRPQGGAMIGPAAASPSACINNLRQIDGAKEQWAIAQDKQESDIPTWQDLLPYLKRKPACPQGGMYTIGPVGMPPACTIPGHQLPQ